MQEGKEEERGLPTLSSRLKALMARAAAHRAVRKEQVEQAQGDEGAAEHPRAATNESSGDNSNATGVLASSPPSSSSLRLLLPPGIAARIAQLILAAQATHGLDLLPSSSFSSAPYSHAHTILDPLRLQAHARTLLAAGDSLTAPAAAVMDVTSMHDCAVAAAHYLSLAGWAAAHFGEELRAPSSSAPDALVVERMVVKPPEETLLLEGPEGALRRRRGGNGACGFLVVVGTY